MKVVKKFKRLAASLMTMFLLAGEFYGAGFSAIAADDAEDDAVIVTGEETPGDETAEAAEDETSSDAAETGAEDEDVPEEGDYGSGIKPIIEVLYVKVNGTNVAANEGKYYGTNGVVYDSLLAIPNGVGYLMYDDLVLTMKDYTLDGAKPITGTGSYLLGKGPAVNIDTNCTGTFTIKVIGDCAIIPAGNTTDDNYAIRCQGNLVIENTTKKSSSKFLTTRGVAGNLKISTTNFNENADWGGCIICGGNLTIRTAEADSFSLNDYDGLTVNCDMNNISKVANPYTGEIYAQNNVSINKARVYSINADGGYANNGIMAENGSVNITGGIYQFGCGAPATKTSDTCGIYAKDDISISNYANVDLGCEVNGHEYKGYGLYSELGQININNATVSAAVDTIDGNKAIFAGGSEPNIIIDGAFIKYPMIGKISEGTIIDTSDNKPAWYLEIVRGVAYDLWIGENRVTSVNCKDLGTLFLGPDTKTVSFDPATGTLEMIGVTGIDTTYEIDPENYKYAAIYSKIPLKITGNGNITANGDNQYGIYVDTDAEGALEIDGQFTINGYYNAIYANCPIKVDGALTTLGVKSGESNAIETKGGFTLEDGTVTAEAEIAGIKTENAPITVKHGTINAKGGKNALYAYKSTIDFDENIEITSPAEATVGTIETESGTASVILRGEEQVKEAVIGSTAYPLTVAQTDGVYMTELSDPHTSPYIAGATRKLTYKGILGDGTVYGPTEDKPTQPGNYRVIVDLYKSPERWRGSADFVIKPFEVTAKVTAVDRAYEEFNKVVELKEGQIVETIAEGDEVNVDLSEAYAEMLTDYSGQNKPVNVGDVKLGGADAWKYSLKEQPTGTTVNISKAVWPTTVINAEIEAGQSGSLSLYDYIAPGASIDNTPGYVISGMDYFETLEVVLATEKINWKIKEGATRAVIELSLPVKGASNYEDYNLSITLKTHEYVVSFEMNGHGEQIQNTKVFKGEALEEPAKPVSKGFVFKGWFTDEALTTAYDFSKPVTADFTLYAKWAEADCGVSPLDPKPYIDGETTQLYLVAGQKFNIGTGWTVTDKASKKLVTISKKGAFKAKKAGDAVISNGTQTISVNICKPVIEKKIDIKTGDPAKAISLTGYGDLDVLWFSAAPDIATVDPYSGEVTAVAKGSAKVTAYINGCTYNCTVKVTEPTPALKRTLHVANGKSKNIVIKDLKKPNWVADVDGIVEIKNNKVTGKAHGYTTLKAQGNDPEYLVDVFVEDLTVTGATNSGKNKYKIELTAGTKAEISCTGIYQDVIFKSSKPDTAFMDEDGVIYARAAGKAKFTAKVNGQTITINVVVK